MPALAVADTSFVVAVFNRRDKHYAEASTFYHVSEQEILLPSVTLTEVAYHLMVLGGGRLVSDALVEIRQGPLSIVELTNEDYDRAAEILRQYHDSRIDFVDSSIMSLAERLKITRILTYDHRDFRLFKPAHVESFTILP